MIDIYTEKKASKEWIIQNDLYFNLHTGNEDMSENEINLIQQVDEAKLTPDKRIETKYGLERAHANMPSTTATYLPREPTITPASIWADSWAAKARMPRGST